jgi:putative FmdB family regulatory protein
MPIYDFECGDCGKTVELLVLGSGAPECSSCGSKRLKKLLSAIAPQGRSAAFIRHARKVAAREGHFSNYSASERPRS